MDGSLVSNSVTDALLLPHTEYVKRLRLQFLPESVIGTKPTSEAKAWCEGDERSLLHDCWLLCTDDRTKKQRDATFIVPFDSVIDVDGMMLSAPESLHDSLTKKIACLHALNVGFSKRRLSAQATFQLANHMDWFFRWRRSRIIGSNMEVRRHHFDDFLEGLEGNDILDLFPMSARLDRLAAEIADGFYVFPLADYHDGPRVEWSALARKLGVGVRGLSKSREFRIELLDRLTEFVPAPPGSVIENLGLELKEKPSVRSARSVEGLLEPWDRLAFLSAGGVVEHDPLTFDPFKDRSTRTVANEIGRGRQRTETLPPPDLLRLMNAAATWVLDYAEHIQRAVTVLRDRDAIPEAGIGAATKRRETMASLDAVAPAGMLRLWLGWRWHKADTDDPDLHGRISVTDAVKHLMTACAILIGGLGARRRGEILSLQTGCVTEEKPGLCELSVYIEKTLRDLDRIPVPALVRHAVEVLETLTADTREATGERWLFRVARNTPESGKAYVNLALDQTLNEFARINGLPLPEGWPQWMLKPHQLRRGFAVFYYHGFQLASLDALSRFLRHFDPEMTRIYVNEIVAGTMGRLREEIDARTKQSRDTMADADRDWIETAKRLLDDLADRQGVFNEVRCEALVHRMLKMWDGTEMPVGKGAARLYGDLDALVGKAAAEVRVGPRSNSPDALKEPLVKHLQTYAKAHYLEPVPGHVAHCTCRPGHEEDLARAECLKAKASGTAPWAKGATPPQNQHPDHAFSGGYVCLTCEHCAAFSENQMVIARTQETLEDAVARAASPAAKSLASAKFERFKTAAQAAKTAVKGRA